MCLKCNLILLSIAIMLLVGCQNIEIPEPPHSAQAEIVDANGDSIGTATLTETDIGVDMTLQIAGLQPGEHGFHIHENGVCEPPDFQTAGGHFNPTGAEHGFEAADGPHLGDLYNLQVNDMGEAETQRSIDGATLGGGEMSVLNKAIVIHRQPDDYESQPSGDAGGRAACGVIALQIPTVQQYPPTT